MNDVDLQQLLQANHRALLLVIDALPFPIYYKDTEGKYLGCNKAYAEYVEISREQLIGKTVYEVFEKNPASIFATSDRELLNNPGIQIFETPVQRSNQTTSYVKFHKATVHNQDGSVAGLIGAIIDITEQKILEKKFQRLATYDDLTGIYNRREGRKQLGILCKDAVRKNRPISVILLDLDDFKNINDTYGHSFGDLILKNAAQCLDRYSRAHDFVCRYGGEEFLIILPETCAKEALNIANRYLEELHSVNVLSSDGENITITASMGVSQLDNEISDREKMLKQADVALYKAKANGKNQACN